MATAHSDRPHRGTSHSRGSPAMPTTGVPQLSEDLQEAERAIDARWLTNPIFHYGQTAAVINLLYVAELVSEGASLVVQTEETAARVLSQVGHALEESVRQVLTGNPTLAEVGVSPPGGIMEAANITITDTIGYLPFRAFFPRAWRGVVSASRNGNQISTGPLVPDDLRCFAYSVLTASWAQLGGPSDAEVMSRLQSRIRYLPGAYSVHLEAGLLDSAMKWAGTVPGYHVVLPDICDFGQFTLGEFRRVSQAMRALGRIYTGALSLHNKEGQGAPGIDSVLPRFLIDVLTSLLNKMSGVRSTAVTAIMKLWTLDDSTVHHRDDRRDVRLRPLVQVSSDEILFGPNLVMGTRFERNFFALVPNVPALRDKYDKMDGIKESVIRDSIAAHVGPDASVVSARFREDGVEGDIDVAIVDHNSRTVLLGEIKWFTDPFDAGAMVDRREELAKAVDQAKKSRAIVAASSQVRAKLGITEAYAVQPVVITANWIGDLASLGADVPIIRAAHLEEYLSGHSVAETIAWLQTRAFLPTEGVDYVRVVRRAEYGPWSLEQQSVNVANSRSWASIPLGGP